ncbi:hypothetical protein BKA70DRAFT_1287530 [Coprinopsis sp. MPI-PUGE-AT-0042]|nr:hypothetical protein BKA70DRAFT_1287530 [Coprinopsis sp. MPI-PUGE-AT-0042]
MATSTRLSNSIEGPQLTQTEKNDNYTSDVQAWTQTLADLNNSTRHAIMTLICRAVFTPNLPESSQTSLVNTLRVLCENDGRKLSAMLQTPFMDNRTPIEWVAGSLPDRLVYDANGDPLQAIPPILSQLLEACGDWARSSTVVTPLYRACAVRSQNALFQLVNTKRTSSHSRHPYTITRIKKSASFTFEIPDFPIRMLSDTRVDLRFIYEGVVCATTITALQPGWRLVFCVIEEGAKSPLSRPFGTAHRLDFQVQCKTYPIAMLRISCHMSRRCNGRE